MQMDMFMQESRRAWRWRGALLCCASISLSIYWLPMCVIAADRVPPSLPRQFQADVSVISHLTDPRQTYPPSKREMTVFYDYEQQVARADIAQGNGVDMPKTFVRRYDQKREYMVRFGDYPKCERAYLGEDMPTPAIPFAQEYVGIERVRDKICEHWVHSYSTARLHVYADQQDRVPIRLSEEQYVGEVPTMTLTYDLSYTHLGPQNLTDFDIPGSYTHRDCQRNVAGFPYIHVFHYYLRF